MNQQEYRAAVNHALVTGALKLLDDVKTRDVAQGSRLVEAEAMLRNLQEEFLRETDVLKSNPL